VINAVEPRQASPLAPANDSGGRETPPPVPEINRLMTGFTPSVAAAAAAESLRINALHDTIELAECAISADSAGDAGTIARMRLYQGTAHRWLGNYAEAERCSGEAAFLFDRGSSAWCTAFGHLVMARGYLGKVDLLKEMASELVSLNAQESYAEGVAIAACSLAVFLTRAGVVEKAHGLLTMAASVGDEPQGTRPTVRAWLDVAHAALALREGDLATHLRRVLSAVENFVMAGDIRNEYLQRANIGNAYVQLGDYEQAIAVFEKVLAIAQPMQLDFVAAVKVNLGLALAHTGRLEEAASMEEGALELCVRQSHLRFACLARVYLGLIRMERGDLQGAETILRDAIEHAPAVPDISAYAHGVMAQLLLRREQPDVARERALTALSLLNAVQGIEEGESLIRAGYAMALRATGDKAAALREIHTARTRIEQRAGRFTDPHQREIFLTQARDNALVMRIHEEWAGEQTLRDAGNEPDLDQTLAGPAVAELGEPKAAGDAVELASQDVQAETAALWKPAQGATKARARRRSSSYWLIGALCAVVVPMVVMSIFRESLADLLPGAPPATPILARQPHATPPPTPSPTAGQEAMPSPPPVPSPTATGGPDAPVVAARFNALPGGAPWTPPLRPTPTVSATAAPSATPAAAPIARDIMH
jgi:tetratricopeptide (TPR) repeat protein